MRDLSQINIQKLFVVVIAGKILSSCLGWLFGSPWILGLVVPLLLMALYIVVGWKRRDGDVSDDKFADSCYYLGFIFTISSIIFSLFDLPNIGTSLESIAVRFGAAMVSTVLGLVVRVYLVTFRKDAADAIADAEDSVIDAAHRFREQLVMAFEKLRSFQNDVDAATKATVERVNLQVEALAKNHSEKLAEFFNDLTQQNQMAVQEALQEIKGASGQMADSVTQYSTGMHANLTKIDSKIALFTDAVTNRLQSTTFPDDYFAKRLEAPLGSISSNAQALSKSVGSVVEEISSSSRGLSGAMAALNANAGAAQMSLGKVAELTEQQTAVLATVQSQLQSLTTLSMALGRLDDNLTRAVTGIEGSASSTSELLQRVNEGLARDAESTVGLRQMLNAVSLLLEKNVDVFSRVHTQLRASADAAEQMSRTFSQATLAQTQHERSVGDLAQRVNAATNRMDVIVERLVRTDRLALPVPAAEAGSSQPAPIAE